MEIYRAYEEEVVVMDEKDRRRFSRVNIQWAVRLDFGVFEYKHFVDNVSLGGLYIEGNFQQLSGDICVISLKQSGIFTEEAVRAIGSITRISNHGIAVEFLSMKLDSFFFLQTTLFCKAINPALLGREFISNNTFEVDGDTVFFESYDFKGLNIKQLPGFFFRRG
ncbi:MAG: PilZ domain-containing protein [Candidatus Electrothrix sp. ATG2]|nr:PilZ domain-containing protein [Candidatus Electrothrix sp. ATG2]